MNNASKAIPPVLERYEMKFVIPEALIEPISEFSSIYCSLDKYSEIADSNFYRVNNLYFDTPYYLFLRKRLARAEKRFNMRIRSYGDDPLPPYFLEIKQKRGDVVIKFRGKVDKEEWEGIVNDPDNTDFNDVDERVKKNKNLFFELACIYNAGPKVLTQYKRKAYISDYEEYARVTFDIDLRYREEEDYYLIPEEERMSSYDIPQNYDPGCNVILELKCYTSHVPLWMIDLIKTFDLKRRGFSKYATGVIEVLNLYKNNEFLEKSGCLL